MIRSILHFNVFTVLLSKFKDKYLFCPGLPKSGLFCDDTLKGSQIERLSFVFMTSWQFLALGKIKVRVNNRLTRSYGAFLLGTFEDDKHVPE